MKTKKKKLSRLTKELLEMADDMHRIGIMGDADYNKIKMCHLGRARSLKRPQTARAKGLKLPGVRDN